MDVRHPLSQAIASALAGIMFLNPIVAVGAQLAVDAAAGGNTQLGTAGNGVPIVNIATPNGAGLSHNKFTDYNVGQNGLILNNATQKTQSTQLGGIIIGNPNLKGGAASKILNEVTGANPSQLRGYTEVAGQAAHVIIANPHGITCNGCGFINTPRATLTTGKPILNGERLQGYDVDGGEIAIEGTGLNASNVDRFELISRATKLNAELYANQLNVVTGRNQVDAETLVTTAKSDDGSAKPQLAIDSSALGGMYAGAIRLVGTEQGVGVKLAGNMAASAGDIQIDANGQLSLAQTSTAGSLRAKASDIALTGPTYAAGAAELNATGQLTNSQSLAAGQRIALNAAQVSNSGIVEAGVNPDNSRNAQGDVAISAQNLRNSGSVVASRSLGINANGTLDNQGGTLKGATTTVAAGTLDNRQGRLIAGSQLTVSAARLDNRNGQAVANLVQVSGGALDNRLGLFSAEQALSLNLDSLDNSSQGTLVSNGTLQASVKNTLNNQTDGLLSAKGALGVQAGSLDNRGGLVVGDAGVNLSASSLNNSAQGVISSQGDLQLDLGQLDNSQGGALDSGAALRLNADQVSNTQGSVTAKGDLLANVDSLAQQGGELLAQGALNLTVGQLDNRNGGLVAANNGVTLTGGDLLNQGGELSSRAGVAIQATSLDNSTGKVIGDAGLNLQVQRITNRAGTLAGRDGLSVTGQSLDNSQGGLLSSQKSIWLQLSGILDNHDQGTLLSQGSLNLSAASLDNRAGTLSSAGTLFARLATALDNQGGRLLSDAGIDLAGGDLNNAGGVLSAAGDIRLHSAKLNNSQNGRIVTDAALHLDSAQLDNSQGGSLSARGVIDGRVRGLDQHGGQLVSQSGIDLDLQGGALNNASGLIVTPGQLLLRNAASVDNRSGEISSDLAFDLHTGELLNQGGKILSGDSLTLTTGALNNSNGGVLSGSNGLSVAVASLDNSQGGTLASRGDLRVRSQGALDNHGDGALVAGGALDIGSATLNNQGGLLSAGTNLQLATGNTDNRNGRLLAQGSLTATTADLDNRDGIISGAQGLDLSAGNVLNGAGSSGTSGGLITSQGTLNLRGGNLESVGGGEISAKGDLRLTVAQLIQQQAALIGEGNVRIDLGNGARGDFDNRSGLLSAAHSLQINGLGNLDNRGGEISSTQGFALTASGTLDNGDQGRIISAGQLTLQAAALRNANQGLLSGWQGLVVNATSLDNSLGGTLSSRNGALNVTLSGALDNHDQGALVSLGDISLAAGSLNNANGIVSTQGNLGLTLAGDLDNRNGGLLSAQGSLSGNGQALDNRGGEISGNGVQLDASSLDNSGGSLSSQGALRLGLLSALLNVGGNAKIVSAGPLNLQAGSVDNRGGQLASQGLLKVLAGRFDNSVGGTLAVQDALTLALTGDLLNGQEGLIFSKAGTLAVTANSLDNAGGTVQGQGDTTLTISNGIGNQSGRLASQAGSVDITSGSLDNSAGGVLASLTGALKLVTGWFGNNTGITQAQSLDLQASGGIDNRAGHLSAVSGDNRITTSDFNNQGGGLYAGNLLYLRGNQLLNDGAALGQGGKIGAGVIDFSLAGALNNQFGLIESSGSLTLGAASINNVVGAIRALGQSGTTQVTTSGLLNNNLGRIESANQDFLLQTGTLQNGGGTVLHVGTGTFGLDLAQAGLAGGHFTSNGSLRYQAASLTNNAIIQARIFDLDVGLLTQGSTGQLLAAQRFIGTGGTWSNDGLIASDGSLDLNLTGSYNSNGQLSSQGDLTLAANQLDLSENGRIAGGANVTLSADTLNNRGRLTSAGDLRVSAGNLNNYATLGSAGLLRLQAGNLLNDGEANGALIFSGDDMTVRVGGTLTNRFADFYSLGGLDLAADDQGGLTTRLDNLSGNLTSERDMRLNVSTLNNLRETLEIDDKGIYTAHITELPCIEGVNAGDCGDNRNSIWQVAQYQSLRVTNSSAASRIDSGGNLNITGGHLLNSSSSISAAGNITATLDTLENQGVEEQDSESIRVFRGARHHYGELAGAAKSFNLQYWQEGANYDPANVGALPAALSGFIARNEYEFLDEAKTNILFAGDQSYAGIIQAGGNVSITARNEINNSVIRNNYLYVNPGQKTGDTAVGGSSVITVVPINSQLPPDLAQKQVNPISLPGFSLPSGNNGLFRLSGQGGSGGSADSVQGGGELIFAGPGIDPSQREVAVGGGAGSADSVAVGGSASAANAQSGASLSVPRVQGLPSSATPDNSHKYLIETNPDLTSLKSFLSSDYLLGQLGYDPDKSQKRLGDGLYEQRLIQQAVVARTGQRFIDGLTSDEDLFKYLMDNAIAYKDSLNLRVGVGLSAEQVAALTHDIVWLEDAVVNGEHVLVPVLYLAQVDNRLGPNGALIAGHDLTLISGGDLANQGTLRASGDLSATAANLNNSGLIEASGRLDLLATDSIKNAQGGIIKGRDVSLTAITGDVINERSVTRVDSAQGSNRTWTASLADSAARIESAGSLQISAGRDIGNLGGVIRSGSDLSLQAGRDVNLTSVELDNGRTNGRNYSQSTTQLGGEVSSGRDLSISAGRDLNAVASRLDAARDAALNAGRDVTLTSAADEQHSYYKSKEITAQEDHVHQRSTELTAGGDVLISAGQDITLKASKIGAGNEAYLVAGDKIEVLAANDSDYSLYDKKSSGSFGQKKTRHDEVTDVNAVGSEISAGSDITLISGGDQKYQGAKLDSGKDIAITSGGEVAFEAVKDLHQEAHDKSDSNLAWQSSQGKGKTDETVRQSELIAQGSVAIKAVDGLKINYKHLDQQSVSQAIDAMVKADPNLAWLKDAEARGDVDWRAVQELHDSYSYSSSGMGPATQLAVAIAAAAIGGMAAAGALSSAGVAGGSFAMGAGVGAAGSLAGTAGVSLINNKGDLGKVLSDSFSSDSLKQMAIASLVGGLTTGYFDDLTGTKTQVPTDKIISPLSTAGGIGGFAANQALQNVTATALSKAMGEGGSFGDALQNTLYNTLAAAAFNAVGDAGLKTGSPQKIAVHALVGGLVAEAAGGDFSSGAIAAGANEALANELRQAITQMSPEKRDALLSMSSELVGVVAASLVDSDQKGLETGAWVAKNATQYNFLNHDQTQDFVHDITACGSNTQCQQNVWVGNGYNQDSLGNLEDALKTAGPARAKDLLTSIQGGLAALAELNCTTTTCESYKFELIDRSIRASEYLDEVYGFGAAVIGAVAGMGGAGVGAKRPGGTVAPGAASSVNKAYEYWGAVRAERAAAAKAPQITLNRQNGVEFEKQVVAAFDHVGGVKNTTPVTVPVNGIQVTTIPDMWGKSVGGMLEVKNVQNLSMSNQLRAQVLHAKETGQPLNLVVSPRTTNVSGELVRQIESTGGGIYRYNPSSGELTGF